MGLESDGVIPPAKVDARDVERDSRTDAGSARRRIGPRGSSGLDFQPHAIIEGVPLAFVNVHQNILVGAGAFRILDGGIHLVEDPEIIETALGIKHVDLTDRCARTDL